MSAPESNAPNLVHLAISDLHTAAKLLARRSGVLALDVRDLDGGAVAFSTGPHAADTYCAALDAGLERMRGIRNRGYRLVLDV